MAVNKIQLADGTVLMDSSEVTVDSAHLMSGYTALDHTGTLITGTASGGTSEMVEHNDVNFIDYDGTLLHSYTASEFSELNEMPDNPEHDGLTAQGWNWSLPDAQAYVAKYGKLVIGQSYITESNNTEIDIVLEDALSPHLAIAPKGTVTIDWGDGTPTDTVTGTSNTTTKFTEHTYALAGSYTITLTLTSGSFEFYCSNVNYRGVLTDGAMFNRSGLYSRCVKAIRIGSNVLIGQYAFNDCYNMEYITIPKGLTSFGTNTFYYCDSLKGAVIPDGLTTLSNNTFYWCHSMRYASVPHSLTTMGGATFYGCTSLMTINIPEGNTSIGNNMAYNCASLVSVTIPDGITTIGSTVFQNCYNLESIVIPEGVTTIGKSAFQTCLTLKSVVIPDTVTSIDITAFSGCICLHNAHISTNLELLSNSLFSGCQTLQRITIPDSVVTIGSSTFASAYMLDEVTIPAGVTSIGASAFNGCFGLETVHVLPTTPPTLGTKAFTSVPGTCIFYVPAGTIDAYKAATNWSARASKMIEE